MSDMPLFSISAPPCLVRRADGKDAATIEALYRELVSDAHVHVQAGHIAALAESPTSFLLVAEIDGTVYATALLTLCPDAMYGTQPFGVIENIIVTHTMRGHGLGRSLMSHMEQIAAKLHCSKLMLLSSQARHKAHAFFEWCGFSSEAKHAFVKYRRQFAEA